MRALGAWAVATPRLAGSSGCRKLVSAPGRSVATITTVIALVMVVPVALPSESFGQLHVTFRTALPNKTMRPDLVPATGKICELIIWAQGQSDLFIVTGLVCATEPPIGAARPLAIFSISRANVIAHTRRNALSAEHLPN